ncbi:trace amine-associated receptor 1-like [Gadus macrocephalus]|uniref:trace amine-associated receptor 1-like n=1 Tax=Gadus macrocephalus TaxID=80720 RepID=UPI0028CB5027|nr:trace amine-associated receptor 1-like [Gadus macrocephalus]
MISPKRSAIRRGLSLGMTVSSVKAPKRENSDTEPGKTSSKEATSSTSKCSSSASWASGAPALKMSMASARSSDGEKKKCLERSPSSGSAQQAAQEAGATKPAAARHLKHARPMEPEFCYGNGSCVRTVYPVAFRAVLYLGLGSAVILTVLGNLFVIVAITHFKQLHTPPNYLTLSLAVTDLLLGVLVMFPSMIQSIETCWYFGDMLCKLFNSSDILLCTASILNLSFISIDRYYAVCHPMLYPRKITVHTAVIMILVTWCVSSVVGFAMIFLKLNILGMEEFYYNNVACEGGCVMLTTGVASTVSSMLSFYIPGVIMLAIYLKIYMVAQRQVRTIGLKNTSSSKVDKHQRKATKTLAIIMGVFLSFWLPFFLCCIIDPIIGYSVPPAVFNTLVWLGYLNSTVNPLVYALFYSWFRKAFQMIVSGSIFRSDMSDTKLFAE